MTKCLTQQTLNPAHHKIAHLPSREKLLPLAPKKPMISRRPALYFIRGIETPSNAPFFPPIPPLEPGRDNVPVRMGAPIVTLSAHTLCTHFDTLPPLTPSRVIAHEAAAENLDPRGGRPVEWEV